MARVALVASWLNQYGGAERVLEVLHDMFPAAPIYTSMYSAQAMPPSYRSWDIRTTFMQYVPGVKRKHQLFLPLYPLAFESLHLNDYERDANGRACAEQRHGPGQVRAELRPAAPPHENPRARRSNHHSKNIEPRVGYCSHDSFTHHQHRE